VNPEVDMTTEHDVLVKRFRVQLKKAEEEFHWVTTPNPNSKSATAPKTRLDK
jgi:hypothetical protein